jgi:LysR family transcriptional regulator, chromosome initiation inhibitor
MFDYASFAAVAAVAREGSFERAARRLNVTTSAVSQRIKLLEERLGTILIVRGQPCTATQIGQLICRHVERVGMLEQDLRGSLPQSTANASSESAVTLRIAVNADSLGTWFISAMSDFAREGWALLDVAIEDEEHTIEWLRGGEVLAAVTAHARPVQGCNSTRLGALAYRAVASPSFVARYFAQGINATTLAAAPSLRFNRKDQFQAAWMRRVCRRDIEGPVNWLPSTQAFLDAAIAGIGWGMNPTLLADEHLKAGNLVELVPGKTLSVPLYWQHTRLQAPILERLTSAVVSSARKMLARS